MNMAIRGIDFNFGKEPVNSSTKDLHPDLRADDVMANPPAFASRFVSDRNLETQMREHAELLSEHFLCALCVSAFQNLPVRGVAFGAKRLGTHHFGCNQCQYNGLGPRGRRPGVRTSVCFSKTSSPTKTAPATPLSQPGQRSEAVGDVRVTAC